MKKILAHPHFIPWFLFIFFTTLYFSSTVGGMNSLDGSQYALTQALVEQRTIKINSFMKWTYNTDYSVFNGQYYSDRDPGLSFAATPFYLLAKIISSIANKPYGGYNINIDFDSTLQAFTYLITVLSGAATVVLIYLICIAFKRSSLTSLVTAILVGTGTLLWRYSPSFYRDPLYTFFFFLSWYLLIITYLSFPRKTLPYYRLLTSLAGLFFGLSIFTDYSKIYTISFFYLYLLFLKNIKKEAIIYFTVGLFFPFSLIFIYNYTAFKSLFTNPHLYQNYLLIYKSNNIFQTPLLPSVIANLFNNTFISPDLLKFHWDNPEISYQMGSKWVTFWKYKGIFVQTPILFLSIIGWISLLKSYFKESFCLLLTAISILLISSKMTVFWGGNTYDTRYFLTTSIIFMLGLPFFLKNIRKTKLFIIKGYKLILSILLILISIYNGWHSNLTNFAPHISGEHRFSFSQLQHPFYSYGNFWYNIKLLFINTFPNIYNIHILFLFYFLPVLLIYFLNKYFHYLLSPKRKPLFSKRVKYRA